MKSVALGVGLIGVALVAGSFAAQAVVNLGNALLPPLPSANGATVSRLPGEIRNLTLVATSLAVLVLGWSWWHRGR